MKVATHAEPHKDEKKEKEIEDWEVEGAMHDFMRVEKHKMNPKLMERVQKMAEAHKKGLDQISKPAKSIADLKKKADAM
jgi:hypothetical protein